jgi:hypothetical protein
MEERRLRASQPKTYIGVQPLLVYYNAVGFKMNPLKELYWKQYGGGPDENMLRKMGSAGRRAGDGEPVRNKKKK